ncbi:dienelactone hydrolase family protein [Pseudoblastomonas halimionae]|uniref:Dienelactone hydrolase family protein n=1 Tax=Alteriqipengyuania halimionae TaxID=1926630 RepID=A0A6I4TYC9_9SPHN|nr:dienelactone hydrolase family protein [Alteriqipengyuania halimionae]MXP08809.1 dienelactone hydrolase family protein [Alteriqipengyuania halimionae]
MCDEQQLAQWARSALSRRGFAKVAGAGAGAAALGGCATMGGGGLTEGMVSVPTAAGSMDAFFVRPSKGPSPAVLFWPDIAGIREAKRQMARRLAGEGFAVLVANPYYRDVSADQFASFADFAANGGFQKVGPWRDKLDAEAIMADARSAIAWLDRQDGVDASRGVGTQGYCMGGPFAIWTAAALPSRVKAAASFHGGGLVKQGDPMSPHNTFKDAQASYLIAIARNDAEKEPEQERILNNAAEAAGRPAEIDVYAGDHGWTVPDSPAYDREAAERAYANLTELYASEL